MKEIIGRKVGMTQVFAKDGTSYPVTVVEVLPNVVTQVKTLEKDGYKALQVGVEDAKLSRLNKCEKGIFEKANVTPKQHLFEIKGDELESYQVGNEVKVDIFKVGDIVDVTGTSKGRGYTGAIARYGFTIGPKGHGSGYHRGVGSLGTMLPMHVLKGKKLPGHMGHETTTIQNLEIVDVDLENNVILVKGNVPGPKKSLVMIRTSVKKGEKVNDSEELITYEDPTTQEQEAEIEAQDAVDEVETEETEVNE